MEKAQVLSNEALSRSGEFAADAARRMSTLDAQATSLKEKIKDLGVEVTHSLYTSVVLNETEEEVYKREVADADAQSAADNRRAIARNAAKAAQAEINRQQTIARAQEERLSEQERSVRALPEDYQSGLKPSEREEQNLARLRAQRQAAQDEYEAFQQIQKQFSPDDAKKFDDQFKDRIQSLTDQIRAQLDTQAKLLAETVRTARDAARAFLADAAQQADRDNPFVSLFVRARTEVEETRKRFLVFGKDFAEMMATVKSESLAAEIAVARFTSGFTALKLSQEARRLEQPFIGLNGPQERRLAVEQATIADINSRANLDRQISLLDHPYQRYGAFEASRDFDKQLRELQGVNTSGAGFAGQKALADAIVKLTDTIDPRVLATSPDPIVRAARDARRGALFTEREASARDIQDAIAREKTGRFIQSDARELLRSINASGLKDSDKIKEYLKVTGELSDKELVDDLRRGRVSAIHEQSRLESVKEKAGEDRARALDNLLKKVDGLITGAGIKVNAGPAAQINISTKDLQTQQSTLGPAMTPESTSSALQRGINGLFGG
jgi:hypothetical protein